MSISEILQSQITHTYSFSKWCHNLIMLSKQWWSEMYNVVVSITRRPTNWCDMAKRNTNNFEDPNFWRPGELWVRSRNSTNLKPTILPNICQYKVLLNLPQLGCNLKATILGPLILGVRELQWFQCQIIAPPPQKKKIQAPIGGNGGTMHLKIVQIEILTPHSYSTSIHPIDRPI